MRWIILVCSFFIFCFISFCFFLWTNRTQLVEQSFNLTLEQVSTKIEALHINLPTSYTFNTISIIPLNKAHAPTHIHEVQLDISLKNLAIWFFLPIKRPLEIDQATIKVLQAGNVSLTDHPNNNVFIHQLEVIFPDNTHRVYQNLQGSPGSLLQEILSSY